MAYYCCICGEKIPFSSEIYYYNRVERLCKSCNEQYSLLKQNPISAPSDFAIEDISSMLEKLKKTVLSKTEDAKIKESIIRKISDVYCGYDTYLAYQNAFQNIFPEKESYYYADAFVINHKKRLFAVQFEGRFYVKPRKFEELIDYSITEDGEMITSGRAGAATVGALLGGVTGAVIGSSMSKKTKQMVEQLDIILSYDGLDAQMDSIHLVNHSIAKSSDEYRQIITVCNQIESVLKQILNEKEMLLEPTEDNINKSERGARAIYAFSIADEILKFRDLADKQIISEEEFEEQKKKLLSLDY